MPELPRGRETQGGPRPSRRDAALTGGEEGPARAGQARRQPDVREDRGRRHAAEIAAGAGHVAAIRAWIPPGAAYPAEPLARKRAGRDWWSLRPIARPNVPDLKTPGSALRSMPSSVRRSSRRDWNPRPRPTSSHCPRLTFDLTGLPPTPEEVEAFVDDPSPDAYERLVDRLLGSPRYGERWGRHWLDVARFGESHGYEMNQPRPNAWPYRDYVIGAFNRDTPLPRFILEQLAADTLVDADESAVAATGFLVGGAPTRSATARSRGSSSSASTTLTTSSRPPARRSSA